jgi:hypothetical protein
VIALNFSREEFAMKTWIVAAALGIALSAAGTSLAFAQAGSTGGTIGKEDKSISGSDEKPAVRSPKPVGRPAETQKPVTTSQYLGCFRDQQTNALGGATTQGRDIDGFITNDASMTSARCIAVCRNQGFPYAGTQYATYCFCGRSYGRSGAADNCNMACGGNPGEMCGGTFANSVYSVSGGKRH